MKQAAVFVVLLVMISPVRAQVGEASAYGTKNTFSAIVEYANDSSHIVLGVADNRKLVAVGVQYEHRLVMNKFLVWKYSAEFRPLILESDPTASVTTTTTSPTLSAPFMNQLGAVVHCVPAQGPFTVTLPNGIVTSGTAVVTCSRRWTYASGLSPFGTRINLMPRHRLQPIGSFFAGYMLSAKTIPIDTAGSFNFTFEFGAGAEYFFSQSHSMRMEYQVQHFSNANTANTNPGVDNGLFKLTYAFGK
jgi:opacity protein-like surface antigen